ncbi:MAG: hypothetical protein ACRCXE_03470 [Metamycoplasmataceae bacterium]
MVVINTHFTSNKKAEENDHTEKNNFNNTIDLERELIVLDYI